MTSRHVLPLTLIASLRMIGVRFEVKRFTVAFSFRSSASGWSFELRGCFTIFSYEQNVLFKKHDCFKPCVCEGVKTSSASRITLLGFTSVFFLLDLCCLRLFLEIIISPKTKTMTFPRLHLRHFKTSQRIFFLSRVKESFGFSSVDINQLFSI